VLKAVRKAMAARKEAFYAIQEKEAGSPEERAFTAFLRSHDEIADQLDRVEHKLSRLVKAAATALGETPAELWERLVAAEVVLNAAGTRSAAPPVFDFYRVSADGAVLGHDARDPQDKLAGMQLGHFAAFLLRSWRANDWMWGRLDALVWLGRLLYPDDEDGRTGWVHAAQIAVLREELVPLADAVDRDAHHHFWRHSELLEWRKAHADTITRLRDAPDAVPEADVLAAFRACKLGAMPDRLSKEIGSRAGIALVTRLAAVGSGSLARPGNGLPWLVRRTVGTVRGAVDVANAVAVTIAGQWRESRRPLADRLPAGEIAPAAVALDVDARTTREEAPHRAGLLESGPQAS